MGRGKKREGGCGKSILVKLLIFHYVSCDSTENTLDFHLHFFPSVYNA